MTLPDLPALLSVASGRDAAILVAAALIGGLVRGFTGFGFAMAFVPLANLVVPPTTSVGVVWNLDAPFAIPIAIKAAPHADWREVLPLVAGTVAIYPVGVWLLTHLDPTLIRWVVGGAILAAVAALGSGLRYRGVATLPISAAIGCLAGLTGGLSSLGGMPIAIFWLGSHHKSSADTRRNLMAYLGVTTVSSAIGLIWAGIVTWGTARQAAILILPYGIGLAVGAYGFRFAPDRVFRQVALAVIAGSAVLSLPMLDGWLR